MSASIFIAFFEFVSGKVRGLHSLRLGSAPGEMTVSALVQICRSISESESVAPSKPDLGGDFIYRAWDGQVIEESTKLERVPGPGVIFCWRVVKDMDDDLLHVISQVMRTTVVSDRGLREHLLETSFGVDWKTTVPMLGAPLAGSIGSSHLCGTFRRQAFWTWDQLEKARMIGIHFGEESLTDINLLEIRTRHQTEVKTKTFTKVQESMEGADWEWWLTGASRQWLGFRVQAKVIDVRSNRYEQLHYKTPSGKPQSTLLCERAAALSPRRIPLYCLYSHWGGSYSEFYNAGGSLAEAPEAFGCCLIDAMYIRKSHGVPGQDTMSSLLKQMVPWHHLFCVESFGGNDLATRALAVWQETIRSEQVSDFSVELVSEPPSYVTALIHNELIEAPDETLRTITIFEERETRE